MKKYRDEIAMVMHDMMKTALSVGAASDADMREFEKTCFVKIPAPSAKNKIEHIKSPVLAAASL
jgi:DNA-binding transcriptional regulator YiaG